MEKERQRERLNKAFGQDMEVTWIGKLALIWRR